MQTRRRLILGGIGAAAALVALMLIVGAMPESLMAQQPPPPVPPIATPTPAPVQPTIEVRAVIYDSLGQDVGRARFTERRDGKLLVLVIVENMPPGFHGMHVHDVGQCVPPDFTSAGGHYNPSGAAHPNHAGDLVPLYVNADGRGLIRVAFDRLTLNELVEGDGTAIVIHGLPDNFANIPNRYRPPIDGNPVPDDTTLMAGDSGNRIACGVLTLQVQTTSPDDETVPPPAPPPAAPPALSLTSTPTASPSPSATPTGIALANSFAVTIACPSFSSQPGALGSMASLRSL